MAKMKLEDTSVSQHNKALACLCSVCGRNLRPAKKRRSVEICKDYNEETFSIDIQGDLPTTHPTHLCQACKGAVYNYQLREVTLQKPVMCKPYSDTCDTCSWAAVMRTGGQPTQDCGRPVACSRRSIISHLKKVSFHPETSEHAPLSFTAPPHYGVSLDDITCPICLSIPNQPIELTDCTALGCSSCLTSCVMTAYPVPAATGT